MKTPSFVSIGSIGLDWIVDKQSTLFAKQLGGNALYGAAGAFIWSDNVSIVSKIGKDISAEYLQPFYDHGIDLSGIKQIDYPNSIYSAYKYDETGERVFFEPVEYFPQIGKSLNPEEIAFFSNKPFYEDSAELNITAEDIPQHLRHAETYAIHALCFDTQKQICQAIDKNAIRVVDPGWTLSPYNSNNLSDFQVLLPSECEYANFAGEDLFHCNNESIWQMNLELLLVKIGRRGVVIFDGKKHKKYHIPVLSDSVAIDPTGAGDSFCGGVSVSWAETHDPVEAALHGMVSASFIIQHYDVRNCLDFCKKEANIRLNKLRTGVKEL